MEAEKLADLIIQLGITEEQQAILTLQIAKTIKEAKKGSGKNDRISKVIK